MLSNEAVRYFGKIQDKDEDYYMQFHLVICGLDSVEARRWINATLINMVDSDNPESLKPLIDGGTEGTYRRRCIVKRCSLIRQVSVVKQGLSYQLSLHVLNAH